MTDAFTLAVFLAASVAMGFALRGGFFRLPRTDIDANPDTRPPHSPTALVATAILIFGTQIVVGGIAIAALGPPAASIRVEGIISAAIYLATALFAVALLAGPLATRRSLVGRAALVPTITARDITPAVVAALVLFPTQVALGVILQSINTMATGEAPDQIAHVTLQKIIDHRHTPWAWLLIAAVVVGAPIVEEILYRGLVLNAWRTVVGPWPAIIASTIIFTLVHIGAGPWYALGPIALVGLACGVLYTRTGRLGPPILLHVLFNAANIALALVAASV